MQSAVSMELNSVFFRTILMPILKKELKAPFLPLLPRKRVVSSLIGEIDESSVENCYKALPSKLSQPLTEELVDCDHLNQRYLAAINHAKNVAPLIILCGGTSGCGKTTLAALIASRFNIRTVLSTDTVREALRNQLARVSVMSGEDPLSTFSELYHSSYEAFKTREPGEELTGHSTTKCRDETIERKRVLDGYHAQANVVLEAVEKVIRQLLERRESAVIEGVHLTPAFMSTIAAEINAKHYQSHGKGLPTFGNCECDCNQSASPSALCVPFFVYISKENTHKERFAVRAKAMTTLRPHKNKYVKNFLAIRIIQQGLLRDLVDMHCMYLMSVVSRSRSMNRGDTLQCEVASSAEYNGGEKREEPNTPSFHHSSSSTFFPIFTVLNTNTDRSVLRIHGHLLRVMDAMRPPHIICGFSNSEKEPSTSESLSSNTSNMIAYTRELRQKYLQAVRDLTIITQVVATKSARLGLLHPATDDEHVDKNMWEYVSNSNTIISSSRERYSELEAGERFQLNRRSQTAPPQLLSYIYGDNYAHNSSPSESGLCFRTDHRQDEDTSSLDTSLFIASELIPSQREVMSAKEALNLINSRKKPKYKRISSFNGNRSHSADNPLVVSGFDSSNNNNNNSNTNYYNLLQKKRLNRLKRKTVNELSPVDHSVKLSQEDATSHFSFISDYRHITRVDDYCSDDELPSVVGS